MPPPTIAELESPAFERLVLLRHPDLVDFAAEYFWRRPSWLIRAHHAVSISVLIALIVVAFRSWRGFTPFMLQLSVACVLFIALLLPLHEVLHAFAYRIVGARDLRWNWSRRGFAVFVLAHRDVVAARPFVFVALTPFVVINAALIAGALVVPRYAVAWLVLLLFHTAGTSGDFALLNFLLGHRGRAVYTFDDAETQETGFYAAAPAESALPAAGSRS
jgi:hypothetical protein